MKKHFALALLAVATVASAGKYGTAGCGLGSLVLGDQKGMIQIVAATINNIIVPQTSAITTGTSNCTEDGVALVDRERALFAEANFQDIKTEVSQGQGENVAVLATLYGCPQASVTDFGSALKSHYATVGSAATAPEMIQAIDGVVSSDASLSSCHTN